MAVDLRFRAGGLRAINQRSGAHRRSGREYRTRFVANFAAPAGDAVCRFAAHERGGEEMVRNALDAWAPGRGAGTKKVLASDDQVEISATRFFRGIADLHEWGTRA